MKALVTDSTHSILPQKLRSAGFEVVVDATLSYERLLSLVDDFDILVVRSKVPIDKHFIDSCHRLKCIGRVGAGMETIDVDYAERRGITCLNSPEGNCDAVGEHTLGLLLSLFDHIARADAEVRGGLWQRELNRGVEVKGKKIGIIGYGHMGASFASRLAGFQCQVLAYDLLGKSAMGFSQPLPYVQCVTLRQLMDEADVLSLHVPLTPLTHYMVNAEFIDAFAKPFYLINTSRGAVVNTAHLADALDNGKVCGAALDVVEYEDMTKDGLRSDQFPQPFQTLLHSPHTVLSPHVAGWTVESRYKLASVLADKIIQRFILES